MTTPGRNDPCSCGSGKKYKRCCLPSIEEQARAGLRAANAESVATENEVREWNRRRKWDEQLQRAGYAPADELLHLANGVSSLIKERRFDEALAACRRLLVEAPDVIDGLRCSGQVHEAIRNHETAIEFYERAIAFTMREDQYPYFDEEVRLDLRESIDRIRARMVGAAPSAEADLAPSDDQDRAP